MKTTKYGICPICGSSCGLIIEVEDGTVSLVKGDKEDPHSMGYVCPKGQSLKHLHSDPDRVLSPLRRDGDSWSEVPWDEALDDIARRISDLRKERGKDSIALFAGDGTTHSYETLFAIAMFITAFDVKNLYTANSMDALPRLFASSLLYGDSGMIPIPDIKRTSHFLILGGNPVVSNGSVMTAPGFARHIKNIRERGGKVVIIDPRRNETADKSDEHHFIYPETDSIFLLSLINVIFEERRDKPGRLKKLIRGYDKLKRLAADFPPDRAAAVTGIRADEIRRIAREFSLAESAVCYGRMGICAQRFGAAASMLADALNIITGNFDSPGGAMFTTPAMDMSSIMAALGMNGVHGKNRSPVSGLPDFNGEMPCAAFAEEIEAGNVRALIVVGGNPAVSVPDSARMVAAFSKLDLMVSLDPHVNATSSCAHYILPPAIGLEHEIYPMMSYATAVHNVAKFAPRVIDPPPSVKYDADILGELTCRILALNSFAPEIIGGGLMRIGKHLDPKTLLKLLIAMGPHGRAAAGFDASKESLTFGDLERNPHGILLGPLEPRLEKLLGRRGRINLMPRVLAGEIARASEFAENLSAELLSPDFDTLLLTSRRQLRFFNTSLHNVENLATGPEQCTLEINPADAAFRGLTNGEMAIVETAIGAAEVVVEVTDRLMPGIVSLPFGWNGPQPKARQKILNENPGTNVNTITNPTRIDPASAMMAFNGTKVKVRKT